MSSYSEYLSRKTQRIPKIVDTRPHRDAGHQTEVVKRLAASAVQESNTPTPSGNMMLNAPSTRVNSVYKKAHTVQDTSIYNAYTAGQAVAQDKQKAPQITQVCYAPSEFNDRLAADSSLAAIQASKNAYQRGYAVANCCIVCGKPPTFKGGCGCSLTVAQQLALPTSVSRPEVPS